MKPQDSVTLTTWEQDIPLVTDNTGVHARVSGSKTGTFYRLRRKVDNQSQNMAFIKQTEYHGYFAPMLRFLRYEKFFSITGIGPPLRTDRTEKIITTERKVSDMDTKNSRTKRASELEAKAKELRRAESAFLREADERRDELLARWGLKTNQNSNACVTVTGGSAGDAVGGDAVPERPLGEPNTPECLRQVVLGT